MTINGQILKKLSFSTTF